MLAASGAGPLASGIGSAVGVSGNLGVTHRERHEQKVDGSFKSHAETLRGFAGGVDVAGEIGSVLRFAIRPDLSA